MGKNNKSGGAVRDTIVVRGMTYFIGSSISK
jgi:hypothetical protein